jgi:hypothetical protein
MTQEPAEPENKPEATQQPAGGSPPEENTQPTASATESTPETPATSSPAPGPVADAGPTRRRPWNRLRGEGRSVPRWAPLAALAIVPALLVGILVYVIAGNGGGSSSAAGIVDGLIRSGGCDDSTTTCTSYNGRLPPNFLADFPIYSGADIVYSVSIASEQGTSYFVVLSTSADAAKVYQYYSAELDRTPWQVEIGRASDEFTGLRFSRPDNIDVSGDITIHDSKTDGRTAIYISAEDTSRSISPGSRPPFTLGITRPLPPGFPNDVPLYRPDGSVVLDTYFERSPGGQAFIISFLTRDKQDDVIKFYTDEFRGKGWNVTDAGTLNRNFALSIDFDDGSAQSLQGQVTANSFDQDAAYTKVDLIVQVSNTRRRGN